MPVLKEEKREQIIKAAKKLFKERGFRSTTIRDIAFLAKLKHSNIRNYFKKKDEIFNSIVADTYNLIKNAMNFHKDLKFITSAEIMDFSESKRIKYIDLYVDFIDTHRDELFLLLFRTEGSSYENVREELASTQQNMNETIFDNIKNSKPDLDKKISPFIFHNLAHFTLIITGEIIKHNVPKEKISEYANDFYIICAAGMKELLGNNK